MLMKKLAVVMISACMLFAGVLIMAPASSAADYGGSSTVDLLAGQDMDVGDVTVWNDEMYLYVKYTLSEGAIEEGWCIVETHVHVGLELADFPRAGKNLNPVPGQFDYTMCHDPCVTEYIEIIPLDWDQGTEVLIGAHAALRMIDDSCYDTAFLYGIQRYTGNVYEIDVLAGTSTMVFEMPTPPGANSASPNGLAYNAVNGYLYYTDYGLGTTPDTLYFWDGITQHEAGQIAQGTVACADFYDGRYYYIPSKTDDLRAISFNPDGTILEDVLIADISGNVHSWTFNGDIAVKDGIVYGWGLCGVSGHGYEFFTYDLGTTAFSFIKTPDQFSLQLAFGSDGSLYGHKSATGGYFYVINTVDATIALVEPTPDPANQYTDTASGEICEPVIYCETAWGDGERFTERGNWATYFCYDIKGWVEFDSFTVSATTATPTESHEELDSGAIYKIVVSGTYYFRNFGNSAGYLADAEWALRNDAYGVGWVKGDAAPYSEPFNGLDLCFDAGVNTDWGALDDVGHTYSILYTGDGSTISLFIKDNEYGDNSGALDVIIYEWA